MEWEQFFGSYLPSWLAVAIAVLGTIHALRKRSTRLTFDDWRATRTDAGAVDVKGLVTSSGYSSTFVIGDISGHFMVGRQRHRAADVMEPGTLRRRFPGEIRLSFSITCPLEQAELYRDRIRTFGLAATIEKA